MLIQTCMTFFLPKNIIEYILNNVDSQTVSIPIDFHCISGPFNENQWELKVVTNILQNIYIFLCSGIQWELTFFKIYFFAFHKRIVIHKGLEQHECV